jgi:hypothetical protein
MVLAMALAGLPAVSGVGVVVGRHGDFLVHHP